MPDRKKGKKLQKISSLRRKNSPTLLQYDKKYAIIYVYQK